MSLGKRARVGIPGQGDHLEGGAAPQRSCRRPGHGLSRSRAAPVRFLLSLPSPTHKFTGAFGKGSGRENVSNGKGRGESEGRLTDRENRGSHRVARVWGSEKYLGWGAGSWRGAWKGWGRGDQWREGS